MILAADTSSRRSTLALYNNGEIFEMSSLADTPSAARFFVLLDALLKAAGVSLNTIDCLALGAGPGSFTGLRVSFAAFRSLAWARGLPLYPVNGLEALAYPYRNLEASLITRLYARRGQTYQCAFRNGVCIDELALLPYDVARARAAALPEPRFLIAAAASAADTAELPILASPAGPDAASIAQLARAASSRGAPPKLEDILPLYLRPSDAELSIAADARCVPQEGSTPCP